MNGVETEIKLLASAAMLEALQRHAQLAGDEHSALLVTTYFDTADGKLHRAGASLRLRSSDGELEQTFKQSGTKAGKKADDHAGSPRSAVQRTEWTSPASGDRPDPASFAPEVAAALAQLVDGVETAAFATVKVQRRTRQIHHGGALIEVAFDTGEIAAAGKAEAICELELELVDGGLAKALQLALALPLGPELRWSVAAKGTRAFALAHGEPVRAVRANTIVIDRRMSVAESFRTICWSCLDHLLANYGLLIAKASNAALHQCRVAIRRLRATLSLFSDSIDSAAAARFRGSFRSAAIAMGEARELHVLLEALAKARPASELPDEGEGGSELIFELTARRNVALASAATQLGSEGFQRLLFEFASWIESVDLASANADYATPETLSEFAARLLTHCRKKVKHAGRHLRAMTDHELHELRIKVKKLRYAMEFFECLAEQDHAKAADKYADVLGKLQEGLGTLHDLSQRSADAPLFAEYDGAQRARLQDEMERRLGSADAARGELIAASAHELRKLLALPRWWRLDNRETDMGYGDEKHAGKSDQLKALQIRLTALQRQVISEGRKLLILFEGRDAAGKDGTIKRIAEHMSPRDTRVVALGVPNERDRKAWYFQRWCSELPVSGEIVLFNRSWYNRAGVERVMGFCSDAEYENFITDVVLFEQLLLHSGFTMIKYYLDISKHEQKRRLHDRETDPLKQWKVSKIDKKAIKNWGKYSDARNEMLARTHSVFAPWVVVKADDKPQTHLAVIRDILARCGASNAVAEDLPDPATAFGYDAQALENGWLAK